MKKFNIMFIMLILFIVTIGVYYENYDVDRNNGEPYITIIPNTSVYVLREDMYYEHYMIVNPPDDLQELKDLIKKYDSNNPVPEETKDGKKPSEYLRQFFMETKYTPRDWKPTEGFTSDDIENHYNDVIAKFSWKREDTKKNYVLWKKDKNSSREILGELRCTE